MKKIVSVAILLLTLLSSCKDSDVLLPNAVGSAFEVLVVVDQKVWKNEAGKTLYDLLNEPTPALPQAEAMFTISKVAPENFDAMLRPARNIVVVTVDGSRFTKVSMKKVRNKWAKNQMVVGITAPDCESLGKFLVAHKKEIQQAFVASERTNQMAYFQGSCNKTALDKAFAKFGVNIVVPISMKQFKEGENFLWISNGGGEVNQNIVIYSYPYTDKKMFTAAALLAKRDSVLKENLPGGVEGSYMGTEYEVLPPIFEEIWVNKAYCAEIRGLWKMKNGEVMGGPFVSHSRLNEVNNRIITVEGFIFAPSREKRNYLRQLEAMIYSLKLPQEINEITVTARK